MQAGYSELEFLRRRSGTVSSLISKFAQPPQQRENRRHTIVGVSVPAPPPPVPVVPQRCSYGSRERANSGAFLANVLARRVTREISSPVTLQDCSNIPGKTEFSIRNNNSDKMYKQQNIITPVHATFTTRKPLTFKTERKFKESKTIDDLKRRTEQRTTDLNRVKSMPNGGTSGAAAARAKIFSQFGVDPNK